MWVLGITFCMAVSGLNTLYTPRVPSLTISGSVVLLLAYPLGKLWEKVLPNWTISLGRLSFDLNPGPFNTKVSPLNAPIPELPRCTSFVQALGATRSDLLEQCLTILAILTKSDRLSMWLQATSSMSRNTSTTHRYAAFSLMNYIGIRLT